MQRHVPKALQDGRSLNETESQAKLVAKFDDEVSVPASKLKGGFVSLGPRSGAEPAGRSQEPSIPKWQAAIIA